MTGHHNRKENAKGTSLQAFALLVNGELIGDGQNRGKSLF